METEKVIEQALYAVGEAEFALLCHQLQVAKGLLPGPAASLWERKLALLQWARGQDPAFTTLLRGLEEVLCGELQQLAQAPGAHSGYRYDVYVSCSQAGAVGKWLKNHFLEELKDYLPANLPHEPRLYLREGGGTQSLPGEDQQALRTARCLLAIWSPEYFRCSSCLSEWQTMRAREHCTGCEGAQLGKGLLYPVIFWDGQYFPEAARERPGFAMHDWARSAPAFKLVASYVEFQDAMRRVAAQVAEMVQRAPAWDAGWPLLQLHSTRAPQAPGIMRFM